MDDQFLILSTVMVNAILMIVIFYVIESRYESIKHVIDKLEFQFEMISDICKIYHSQSDLDTKYKSHIMHDTTKDW